MSGGSLLSVRPARRTTKTPVLAEPPPSGRDRQEAADSRRKVTQRRTVREVRRGQWGGDIRERRGQPGARLPGGGNSRCEGPEAGEPGASPGQGAPCRVRRDRRVRGAAERDAQRHRSPVCLVLEAPEFSARWRTPRWGGGPPRRPQGCVSEGPGQAGATAGQVGRRVFPESVPGTWGGVCDGFRYDRGGWGARGQGGCTARWAQPGLRGGRHCPPEQTGPGASRLGRASPWALPCRLCDQASRGDGHTPDITLLADTLRAWLWRNPVVARHFWLRNPPNPCNPRGYSSLESTLVYGNCQKRNTKLAHTAASSPWGPWPSFLIY